METSAIGQGASMQSLYGTKPPSAKEMANHVFDDLDTNKDGKISADEAKAGGDRAKKILEADADGDGTVTVDELVNQITTDMKNGPPPPSSENETSDNQSTLNVTA